MQDRLIEQLWAEIDATKSIEDFDRLYEKSYQIAVNYPEKHELFHIAGYVAYTHPFSATYKDKAQKCFTQSLLYKPGYLPAVLYLAYMEIDCQNFQSALQILYAFDLEQLKHKIDIDIYFEEAKVFALIKCNFWHFARDELSKFDKYLQANKEFSIDLINFMKLINSTRPNQGIEQEVIDKISFITTYLF